LQYQETSQKLVSLISTGCAQLGSDQGSKAANLQQPQCHERQTTS
jgi:hypothetical protein